MKIPQAIRNKLIHLCILISFTGTLYGQKKSQSAVPYSPDKKFSAEELQSDLAVLKEALIKTHPGLFWYVSEAQFNTIYTKTKESITAPMTDLEFYISITPFINAVRCGHTDLEMSEMFYKYCSTNVKVLPLALKIINSKIYVVKNYTDNKDEGIGCEIISINEISADSILRFLKPQGWSDGFTSSSTRINIEYFQVPALLYLFNYPNNYRLKVRDRENHLIDLRVEALDYRLFEERSSKQGDAGIAKNSPFRFNIIDSLNTAVIRIESFMGNSYYKFLESSFKTIEAKKIENLIIDLRGNDGGDGYYSRPLYEYISSKEYRFYDSLEMNYYDLNDPVFNYGEMPLKKKNLKKFQEHKLIKTGNGKYLLKNGVNKDLSNKPFKSTKKVFEGDVFILTDVRSSSTTSEFCAIAHYNKEAKFIGRETGGGYCGNTSGWEFTVTLPNTKLVAHIPLIRYYMAVQGPYGRGVQPDYPLAETIDDVIFKRDSDMQFTLNLISQKKK